MTDVLLRVAGVHLGVCSRAVVTASLSGALGTWHSSLVIPACVCDDEVPGTPNDVVGHVMTHMDDAVRGNSSSGLRLACGCADAVWPVGSNFPTAAVEHLQRVHGMRR